MKHKISLGIHTVEEFTIVVDDKTYKRLTEIGEDDYPTCSAYDLAEMLKDAATGGEYGDSETEEYGYYVYDCERQLMILENGT